MSTTNSDQSEQTDDISSEQEDKAKYWEGWKAGRPTKYSKKFPEMLIEHMKGTGSFEAFGALVNVGVTTLYMWERIHEDFRKAKEVGKSHQRNSLEKLGISGMTGQIKQLKKETTVTKTVGSGDKAVTTTTVTKEWNHFWSAETYRFYTKNVLGWKDTIDFGDSDWINKITLNGKEMPGGKK